MPVKVRCSGCEKVLNAPDKVRGKTVKCPNCQSPIKVPTGKSAAKSEQSDMFGDDFLADLDLRQAEDRSQRVCPRCGSPLKEFDEECGSCGVDLSSGGAPIPSGGGGGSPIGKKKRKGPNKSEFFRTTFSDAWRFLKKNKGYAIKTSIYMLLLLTFQLGCLFMLVWCVNVPPRLFWLLMTFTFSMAPIGWIWHLFTETIKHSLGKKDELKRVNFDFFTNVAFGIKYFFWQLVVGIPFVLVLGGGGALMMNNGATVPAILLFALCLILITSLLPVGWTHMAMPQQVFGWMPNKVYPGWAKSLGAIAYWLFIMFLTSIPVTGTLGAVGAVAGNQVQKFSSAMSTNAQIYTARELIAAHEKKNEGAAAPPALSSVAQREPVALPWNGLTVPFIGLAVALIFCGPVAVFNARVAGQLAYYYSPDWDLNVLEKQLKYTKKDVKLGPDGKPIVPKKPAWLVGVLALVVIIVLFFVGNFISFQLAGKTIPAGLFGSG